MLLRRFSILSVALAAWPALALAAGKPVDFVRDIQPIFERACAACHGPAQQLGQLRLDARDSVLTGGLSGKTVVAGDPETSELYRRVAGLGDQARMPMGGELPAAEIETLRRWIEQGAPWPAGVGAEVTEAKTHWAFVPPVRPALPVVRDRAWTRNPIDRFILARLEAENLKLSPPAKPETLLRRAHLDVTGLPPSIAEADAFLASPTSEAYAKLVDRLLESPHYGERWARHWLDAARYSDSDGFEKDKPRNVWFYRDWVVGALNRDLPYDRFLVEQLAGDLLPGATQDQVVATGFLRNSMINEEGGIDPEQFRMEAMFERVDALGKSVMGLTVGCAQCHNHKFDPLTQEEYYRLFAFLNNSHEANIAVYTPEEQVQRTAIYSEIAAIEEAIKREAPDWRERMAAWERETLARERAVRWAAVTPQAEGPTGQKYIEQPDGSILAQGYAPTIHTVTMSAEIEATGVRAIRLDLLNDPNLPLNGPGRSTVGVAALTEFEVEIAPKSDPKAKRKILFVRAEADANPTIEQVDRRRFPLKQEKTRITGGVEFAIDGCDETAWSTDIGPERRNRPRAAVFVADEPFGFEGGTIVTFHLAQKHGGWNSDDNQNQNLGRWRLSYTADRVPEISPLRADVLEALATPSERRALGQTAALFALWRETVPEWRERNARIEQLWREHPKGSSQLVLMERAEQRPTRRLERGDFLKPKEEVEPGVPRVLNALHADAAREPNRLDFARWLVSPDSPTTARTMVNRVWQSYFGTGLVETAEDLGTRAPDPSHPELLDWLAVEFVESGWSLKHLHRLILTSNAYQQMSSVSPELLDKDPKNRLLARGARFRVEAEIVRDIALAASGLLNPEVGGRPVYPPAPDFLFLPPASYGPKQWHTEQDEQRYRRALYTFRFRSVPYPALDAFDAPNGDAAIVRRARSNTPLQALTTLNEDVFLEAARALARLAVDDAGPTDAARLDYAFRRVLTRRPEAAERDELLSLLDRRRRAFTANPEAAREFAGEAAPDLAAWTAVSRVLLNLDETITKE